MTMNFQIMGNSCFARKLSSRAHMESLSRNQVGEMLTH